VVKVLKERSVTLAEVKRILEEKGEREELTTIEQTTLEYARKFAKIDHEAAAKLVSELVGCGISEEAAIQVANIMPESTEELRTILMREEVELTPEFLTRVLEIVDKYRGEAP